MTPIKRILFVTLGAAIAGMGTHLGFSGGGAFLGGIATGLGAAVCWGAGYLEGKGL